MTQPLSIAILGGETRIIKVNCTLPSGNYNFTITNTKGAHCFWVYCVKVMFILKKKIGFASDVSTWEGVQIPPPSRYVKKRIFYIKDPPISNM
jgi:hypothetical protein